jgi:hypothetical protein
MQAILNLMEWMQFNIQYAQQTTSGTPRARSYLWAQSITQLHHATIIVAINQAMEQVLPGKPPAALSARQ